jgi:hypothetical protein
MRPFITSVAVMYSVCLAAAPQHRADRQPVAAAGPGRIALLVYDSVGIRPDEMRVARLTVNAILMSASIQAEWQDCSEAGGPGGDSACSEPPTDTHLVVRIVAATPTVPFRSLGSALVDVRQRRGILATVYADHVHARAEGGRTDPGVVLGRTIAHEIGHMLKGSTAHGRAGLMRARWSEEEMRRNLPGDWQWSSRDLAEIAHGTALRAASASSPSQIVASTVRSSD